jgi:hypothetical protein
VATGARRSTSTVMPAGIARLSWRVPTHHEGRSAAPSQA